MSYIFNNSSGNPITVADGVIGSVGAINMIGKNTTNYGTALNQNFYKLMENFAFNISPTGAITGQCWYDTQNLQLKVFNGTSWKAVGGVTNSEIQPSTPSTGDLWLDVTNQQLNVYNGTSWIIVGPSSSATAGKNGFVTESVTVGGTVYYVASLYANNTRVAILFNGPGTIDVTTATPSNPFAGFTILKPGINYSSSISGVGTNYGNISATGNISTTANITAGANIIATGNITTTANINAGNLTISGITNIGTVGNVRISGGSTGQVLSTDGSGNLSWIANGAGGGGTGNIGPTNINATGNIISSGYIATSANISALGNIASSLNITASGNITATGNVYATNLVGHLGNLIVVGISSNPVTCVAQTNYAIKDAITLNLPTSPQAGDWVGFYPALSTVTTYNIYPGSSGKIMGGNAGDTLVVDYCTRLVLVYSGDTGSGWVIA